MRLPIITKEDQTMDIQTALKNLLIGTGRISPNDRVEIIEKSVTTSDWARIGLHVYRRRNKKPFVYWNICVNLPRETVHWDLSTFYYI